MVTASSIGAGKGGDYGRYLESKTVEPEHGDYYLNPTGEPVQAPGRWLAQDDTLALLGITADVPLSLREEFSQRAREVAHAIERFRAKYGRAPERDELHHLKLENRKAKQLTTRSDLQRAWQQTAREHDFGPDQAARLISAPEPRPNPRQLADRVEERLTERAATFEPRELRATALEQAAGELPPDRALQTAREMVHERRVLPLEGGLMTTLEIRAKEQTIDRQITDLAQPAGRDITRRVRERATRAVSERIGAPLTREQREALDLITGPERWAVLIGQAGTGKGVVIDAAARAEQDTGRQVIGVAIAGATAERLGHDSPSLQGHTMTVDALLARTDHGRLTVDHNTTVFYDEAGMSDTRRLERFTRLIHDSGAKAVTIGDPAQLPSIGAGGMFERLINIAPTAQLEAVHRTHDHHERKAWAALRHGDPAYAMAHYQSRGQLHQRDTRELAAEAAVKRWAEHLDRYDPGELVILSDSSNQEVDRLNARAQHLRHQRGELGEREIPHPDKTYSLRERDRVIFAAQHQPPGQARVENGSLGHITHIHDNHVVTVALDATDREIHLARDELSPLRLAYAQHISRQQGATVQRAVALTGGWQTSRETSYVQASRARHGIDWFIARDNLGTDGTDPDRINRLAERMRQSRRQTPSLQHPERPTVPAVDYRSLDRGLDRAPSLAPGLRLLSQLTRAAERDSREPDRGR